MECDTSAHKRTPAKGAKEAESESESPLPNLDFLRPRRCVTTPPMLPSPYETPEPIAGSAPLRRRSPDAGDADAGGECRVNDGEKSAEQNDSGSGGMELDLPPHPTDERSVTRASDGEGESPHPADAVPMGLARTVVNLHEFYNSKLEEQTEKNRELQAQQNRMAKKMDEMDRRLNTHVVLMEGIVGFMTQVKEGRFAVAEARSAPEVLIAQTLGDDHLEVVQGLMELRTYGATPEAQDEEMPTVEGEVEEDLEPMQEDDETFEDEALAEQDDFNELPPTPDMNTAPLRSTGVRAPKRRDPFAKPRQSKRRARRNSIDETLDDMEYCPTQREFRFRELRPRPRQFDEEPDQDLYELRNRLRAGFTPASLSRGNQQRDQQVSRHRSGWTPINADEQRPRSTGWTAVNVPRSPIEEEVVSVAGECESDYDPSDEEDEASMTSSPPASPGLSASSDLSTTPAISSSSDPSTSKPRYSAPRRTGHRHASGPPSRRFVFHRMPKTVALIWKEYKDGLHGNPSIESLEEQYGTGWRTGTLSERKYASNYVGVRQKIVRYVEGMVEGGMSLQEALGRLDGRVDGRIQLLQAAIKEGKDPLEVIPER